MVPVFKNLGKVPLLKASALLVFFLWLVKSEKLVNNRIVDYLEKSGFFSDFHNCFRLSRSIAGVTQAVAIDICKSFDRVLHAGFLHKLGSYEISGQVFGLIYSFLKNRRLWVVLIGKSPQEYPINAGVPQESILGSTVFLLYINDLSVNVICNIAILLMILLSTLNVIRHLICGNN